MSTQLATITTANGLTTYNVEEAGDRVAVFCLYSDRDADKAKSFVTLAEAMSFVAEDMIAENIAAAHERTDEAIASYAGLDDIDLDDEVVDADAPTTSVEQPGDPLWNCCVANPSHVMVFDDSSAVVVCTPCSHTVAARRIHDLPAGWRAAHEAKGRTTVEPRIAETPAMTPTNATAVSRALHAGGLRPIPTERRWRWNGVNVTGATARYGRGRTVHVDAVCADTWRDGEFSVQAEVILIAAGYIIERRDATSFAVLGRAA